jgi:hypothetical protein
MADLIPSKNRFMRVVAAVVVVALYLAKRVEKLRLKIRVGLKESPARLT